MCAGYYLEDQLYSRLVKMVRTEEGLSHCQEGRQQTVEHRELFVCICTCVCNKNSCLCTCIIIGSVYVVHVVLVLWLSLGNH